MDIRKKVGYFLFIFIHAINTVMHRLPRETVDALPPETFKIRQDWALSNLT